MKKSHFLTFVFSTIAFTLIAQHPNILISNEANPNEISIAMDSQDPMHLLAGANIASIFTSDDGGIIWNRIEQKSTHGVWGDPVVAIDQESNYYHFHLSKPEDGNYIDRIVCQKSTDRGKRFNNGTYAGLNGEKAQDKPWVVIDRSRNILYLSWTQFDKYDSKDPDDKSNIMFSKSMDSGETWSEAIQINSVSGDCLDDDGTVEGAVPAVAPNGDVYVTWIGPNGLVYNRSMDGGNTWLQEEQKIHDIPGGWSFGISGINRANGFPIIKIDRSNGKNHGTIYINWSDQRNGEHDTDIWLTKSKDQGKTWTDPIRVNQDETQTQQFFTWMDIDQTNGNLYFVYHDRRNHTGDSTDVYISYTKDGGESFGDVKISESAFMPNDTVFFGDYNNIAAHGDVIRPVWTRLDNTKLSVWTSIIDNHLLDTGRNRDFKATPTAQGMRVSLKEKSKAGIQLKRMDGSLVYHWGMKRLSPKETILEMRTPLKPGVYLITADAPTIRYSRSIVVKAETIEKK